jgi:recombination protein RecR
LAKALEEMSEKVKNCTVCFNLSESDICPICSSSIRDSSKLCVLEEPLDLISFENSGIYSGKYFILGGVISPADGISADEIRVNELKKHVMDLLNEHDSIEIIIATNPSLEGEATASYLSDMLRTIKDKDIKITRLAMGLPTGADLEFADSLTLKRAFDGRGVYN